MDKHDDAAQVPAYVLRRSCAGPEAREAMIAEARWKVLASTWSGAFLVSLAVGLVAVSAPVIAHDLHRTQADVGWVLSAYLLAISVVLAAAGRLADVLGRRRVYLIGLVVFGIASAACGAAPTLPLLVCGRVVQGIGAALLSATAPGIIMPAFPPNQRARALGLLYTATYGGLTLGPIVGGITTAALGWHAMFYVLSGAALAFALVGYSLLGADAPSAPPMAVDPGPLPALGRDALAGDAAEPHLVVAADLDQSLVMSGRAERFEELSPGEKVALVRERLAQSPVRHLYETPATTSWLAYASKGPQRPPFDVAGSLLFALGLATLIIAVRRASGSGSRNAVAVLLTTSVISLALFARQEARHPAPLLPLTLLRTPAFAFGVVGSMLIFISTFVLSWLLPLHLEHTRGLDPRHAGLLMTAQPATTAFIAPVGGLIADRFGSRTVAMTGMLVVAGGLFLVSLKGSSTDAHLVGGLAVVGLGAGLFVVPNDAVIMTSVAKDRQGTAVAMSGTARNMGMTFGVALAVFLHDAVGFAVALTVASGVAVVGALLCAVRPARAT